MVMDRGRRREADRLRDLPDGRGKATSAQGRCDVIEDPDLAVCIVLRHPGLLCWTHHTERTFDVKATELSAGLGLIDSRTPARPRVRASGSAMRRMRWPATRTTRRARAAGPAPSDEPSA